VFRGARQETESKAEHRFELVPGGTIFPLARPKGGLESKTFFYTLVSKIGFMDVLGAESWKREQRKVGFIDAGDFLTTAGYGASLLCPEYRFVMDPKSWTRIRPFLRWSAALKMEERQCHERVRITRPA
jgi:hypothetical protein